MRLIDETAYQNIIAKIPMDKRTFVKAWETAQDMPTVDAVEVVRCKECYKFSDCKFRKCWHIPSDFYCSDGRRESEGK